MFVWKWCWMCSFARYLTCWNGFNFMGHLQLVGVKSLVRPRNVKVAVTKLQWFWQVGHLESWWTYWQLYCLRFFVRVKCLFSSCILWCPRPGPSWSLEYSPIGCFPEPVILNTQAIQCSSKMGTKEAVQEHGSCCQFMSYSFENTRAVEKKHMKSFTTAYSSYVCYVWMCGSVPEDMETCMNSMFLWHMICKKTIRFIRWRDPMAKIAWEHPIHWIIPWSKDTIGRSKVV